MKSPTNPFFLRHTSEKPPKMTIRINTNIRFCKKWAYIFLSVFNLIVIFGECSYNVSDSDYFHNSNNGNINDYISSSFGVNALMRRARRVGNDNSGKKCSEESKKALDVEEIHQKNVKSCASFNTQSSNLISTGKNRNRTTSDGTTSNQTKMISCCKTRPLLLAKSATKSENQIFNKNSPKTIFLRVTSPNALLKRVRGPTHGLSNTKNYWKNHSSIVRKTESPRRLMTQTYFRFAVYFALIFSLIGVTDAKVRYANFNCQRNTNIYNRFVDNSFSHRECMDLVRPFRHTHSVDFMKQICEQNYMGKCSGYDDEDSCEKICKTKDPALLISCEIPYFP